VSSFVPSEFPFVAGTIPTIQCLVLADWKYEEMLSFGKPIDSIGLEGPPVSQFFHRTKTSIHHCIAELSIVFLVRVHIMRDGTWFCKYITYREMCSNDGVNPIRTHDKVGCCGGAILEVYHNFMAMRLGSIDDRSSLRCCGAKDELPARLILVERGCTSLLHGLTGSPRTLLIVHTAE
jgi:hypothetical protein